MRIGKDEVSGHGLRARTILIIEHQLAHAARDSDGRTYNRTAVLPERRHMTPQYATCLDKVKSLRLDDVTAMRLA